MLTKTAKEQQQALSNKEVSARELVDASYNRINEVEDKLNSFLSYTKDLAYQTADEVDKKLAQGEKLPPLAGIPIGIKDAICVKDYPTTAASKMLENFVPCYDATVIKKIKTNMMPIIGKLNLDEFAMGGSTENSAFKITKNPWDLNKVPGGSSGGSATSVSGCEVPLSLGTDTGGSIRLPASFCGLVGLKPTYGRVSRFGLIAFASSLDQIGPIGRSVEDVAMLYETISGYDANDSTSINTTVPCAFENLKKDIKGMKIGVIKELMSDGLQAEVKGAIENAIKTYESLGAEIVEVSMPHSEYAIAAYYILATAEASANLARYDGVKYGYRAKDCKNIVEMQMKSRQEGFGDEVKRRIMLGTYALSSGYYDAYYKKAQQLRRILKEDYDKAFAKADVLLSTTCPTTAFDIGSKVEDPLSMYLMDIATITANLAGLPAMSLPCGFDNGGMPIGLQLLAPHLQEAKLLQTAYAFENVSGLKNRVPEISF